MEQDLIVFYLTNKGMYGDKTQNYYASGFLPRGLVEKYPEKVFVVDIDALENQAFLQGDRSQSLYAFPVDKDYQVSNFEEYKKKSAPLERERVCFVVPYTSSEADETMLRNITVSFPKNTQYANNPDSMVIYNSKSALERVRRDPRARAFSSHINPQIIIQTEADYQAFKENNPNFVLRGLRSTEGAMIFVHAPNYYEGKTEIVSGEEIPQKGQSHIRNLLKNGPLLASVYIDTAKTGDTRIYGFYDPLKGIQIIDEVARRWAPPQTEENLCPKCNVSSGGSFELIPISEEQKRIAFDAMSYYHEYCKLGMIGFDFLGNTLSEINNSADSWNLVHSQTGERGDKLVIEALSNSYQKAYHEIQTEKACEVEAKKPTRIMEQKLETISYQR